MKMLYILVKVKSKCNLTKSWRHLFSSLFVCSCMCVCIYYLCMFCSFFLFLLLGGTVSVACVLHSPFLLLGWKSHFRWPYEKLPFKISAFGVVVTLLWDALSASSLECVPYVYEYISFSLSSAPPPKKIWSPVHQNQASSMRREALK